jgi:hypothetical protein
LGSHGKELWIRQKTKAPMVYANGRMDNPLDHSPGFAKAAHKASAVELLLLPVQRENVSDNRINPCGSELAREEAGASRIDVD